MSRRALIFGISGQDGSYLAELLLRKGYAVHGTSRDAENSPFRGLHSLGIRPQLQVHSASLADFRDILQVVSAVEPDEIYNLAGQSSVGLSFSQPRETFESIALGTLQILEVLRYLNAPIRFYNACSSECFGAIAEHERSVESSPFSPRSPYATAKASAFWHTKNYREAYGLFACSGILFNHESPLRPARFVTQKIISAVVRIANGSKEKLELGNLDIVRDWGWAPDYVDAMWRMLQTEQAEDFVIATGESHSLQEFLDRAFAHVERDWREHVQQKSELLRPSDIAFSAADPSRAKQRLDWAATCDFDLMVQRLIDAEREAVPRSS